MKKIVGIEIDNTIRDWHTSFHKTYIKKFIYNPSLIDNNTTQEQIEEMIQQKINLPINTEDLLNHYHFDEFDMFETPNLFDDSATQEYFQNMNNENFKLSPQEHLHFFMYYLYPFAIFAEAEEYDHNMRYFNIIQQIGLETNKYETILLTTTHGAALTATFFYLAKTGARCKHILKVNSHQEKWNYCDIIIDTNSETFYSKPTDKHIIKIIRPWNTYYIHDNDIAFHNLKEIIDQQIILQLI